ncbi:unnamed protein product [Dovyalis caffra]|uniref:Uncharacterized protein n=1 Tax=Dovyalis caffra TaxID=77055 RepID=A0AAV1SSW9_9ROSI|nr:unnamed protein product [Dovyalis caffra]
MHAAICFLIFVLLALLQIKYQNKGMSPFEAHGTIILLFIVSSFVYSMALLAFIALLLRAHQQQLEALCFFTVLKHISLVSGALTCDLLLLILCPAFGYFVLIFCGVVILVRALLGSYQQILGRLLDVAATAVSSSMTNVSTNLNSTNQGGGDHTTTQIVSV